MSGFTELTGAPWQLAGCRELYRNAFPAQERLDFDEVFTRRAGARRVLLASTDEQVDGFAVWLPLPRCGAALLEYLAVQERSRGNALGSRLVAELVQQVTPGDLLAELEPAWLSAQAERRQGFYRRLGFVALEGVDVYGMPSPEGELLPMELWHLAGRTPLSGPAETVTEVYEVAYGELGRSLLPRLVTGGSGVGAELPGRVE